MANRFRREERDPKPAKAVKSPPPKPKAAKPPAPPPPPPPPDPMAELNEEIQSFVLRGPGEVAQLTAVADKLRGLKPTRDKLRLLKLGLPTSTGLIAERSLRVREVLDFFLEDA